MEWVKRPIIKKNPAGINLKLIKTSTACGSHSDLFNQNTSSITIATAGEANGSARLHR